jgi:ubiquinone/menaquinone biosynthesis C-methylase UbiE
VDEAELWPAPARRKRWLQLMNLLQPRPGERILDVGCGRGQAVIYLAQRVGPQGRVIGVDIQEGHVATAEEVLQEKGLTQAQVMVADAAHLPFADGSFDAVLCVNVLEAVPDRLRALSEMRRVLRPGGRALVAHDDHESQVYVCEDRSLCRRVVQAYSEARFESYACSEGQMGRRLWALFRRARFQHPELHVLPLVETDYSPPHMGWSLSQFSADLVAESVLTEQDLERWRSDLAERAAQGEYLYAINLYVCFGYK